jgi:hypothetical protein
VIPKVTSRPVRAAAAARSTACWKAAGSAIAWSDGITSIRPSGSLPAMRRAATAAAGAVLRPTGSSNNAAGAAPISRSCSAMMKRCSSLATIKGDAKPGRSMIRCAVCCSRLASPNSARSCFGYSERDIGHSRVPEPPDRITG